MIINKSSALNDEPFDQAAFRILAAIKRILLTPGIVRAAHLPTAVTEANVARIEIILVVPERVLFVAGDVSGNLSEAAVPRTAAHLLE